MITKTICCKLLTNPASFEALKETSIAFAAACNFVLRGAIAEKTHNAIKLHHLFYFDVRRLYGLSANLAVRASRRVVACMTKLKGKRKTPKLFKPKSIDYDARIFNFQEIDETVSLTTIKGRIRIPLILGEHQRKALLGKNPTSATVINKAGVWYIHMVVEENTDPSPGKEIMGVDLGITNIATTSTDLMECGRSRQQFKQKRAAVRASLQSKGTKGAKKVLKRISNKENRRIKYENHVLSKKLVEEAKRHNCGIVRMERLKDIRSRTKTWNKHLNRMVAGWSFYQLQQFVEYKAGKAGIAVEYVNPAYTSQTCHQCLKLGSRKGERFSCATCGDQHADANASRVIAIGGASVNTPKLAA